MVFQSIVLYSVTPELVGRGMKYNLFVQLILRLVTLLLRLNQFASLFQVKSLVFDQSGTYLAVGGSDIRVYICKQWSEVLNFTGAEEKHVKSLYRGSSSMHAT